MYVYGMVVLCLLMYVCLYIKDTTFDGFVHETVHALLWVDERVSESVATSERG